MSASTKAVQAALDQMKRRLLEAGLLEDWNPSVVEKTFDRGVRRVTWATNGVRPELVDVSLSNVREYLLFLEGRHYQFKLVDGSLIQVSYDVRERSSEVVQSRLVWYPCPVSFAPEEVFEFQLSELILSSPTELINLQAPLRIDYAPNQVADNHSTTHMHLGREEFRLPVQRPMEPCRFLRLIIRSAFPHVWSTNNIFRDVEDWTCNEALNDDDKLCGSLSWHLPIQVQRPT
jgi:hypothetical protein